MQQRHRREAIVLGGAIMVVAAGVAALVASEPGRVGPVNSPAVGAPTGSPSAPSRPEFAWGSAHQGPAARSWLLAQPSRCTARHRPGSYAWPVKPFDHQHPIRGFFGDPRTVFRNADDADLGAFSFHNGVDIVAAASTPVYPVLSGTVTAIKPDEIVVTSPASARTFQYWHLNASVRLGERVHAARTILGTVQPGRGHVHLTEIDNGIVENPLQPGHLTPYRDHTLPSVEELYFRNPEGRTLSPEALTGRVEITAAAVDEPPLPLAAPWAGVPITPARVSWQLSTLHGRELLPAQTPADFSVTIPPPNEFWSVYARGTYQNFPTVGLHYFYGTPGDYLFNLTPTPLETRLLEPGRYRLTVVAADTCGNQGSLSEEIRVLRQPTVAPLTGTILNVLTRQAPAARFRWPRRFWTVVLETLPTTQGRGPARAAVAHALEEHRWQIGLLALSTTRRPRSRYDIVISGLFNSWAAAYTAAQHAAPSFPNAHPCEIVHPNL